MIPYGRQSIDQHDIDAVVEVLTSDFLTQGPKVPLFEKAVAEMVGAKHGVAMNSATSALHVACMALGLGPGDRLWTSPVTFVASANCGLYCGAIVDFVDIDPQTYNMCPKALRAKLELARSADCLPKIVIPVHLAGQSCDMSAIGELSREFGFRVIEDASHAIGATFENRCVGSAAHSDIVIFSFHPVKIITTAEGGMAVTQSAELARKMEYLRSHGVTRDPDLMIGESHGPWYYQQIDLGYNYRMTELQAALGLSQTKRLAEFVARRQALAKAYDEALAELPLILPYQDRRTRSSFHLYIIRVPSRPGHRNHSEVFAFLRAAGIGVNLHYIPVHLQPYYANLGFHPGDFPVAEAYYSQAISIPLFAGMTDADQSEVISALRDALV
jgi:UDP-4-amino-4,6-dideoxy-N-acetyl-beta-L-altrosamine transaminase